MAEPTVLFADTVSVVRAIVEAAVAVPVRNKVPNPRPATFVKVSRTGGIRMNKVADNAQITVEAWGSETSDAHDLAQVARRALHAAQGTVVEGVTVYAVREVSGPGELPDPLSDQPRVTQAFTVATRGA